MGLPYQNVVIEIRQRFQVWGNVDDNCIKQEDWNKLVWERKHNMGCQALVLSLILRKLTKIILVYF